MKYIKLDCTRGGVKNPVLTIGDGKGEISLEEAKTLVAERMAFEFIPEAVEADRIAELEGQITELVVRNAELEGQLSLPENKAQKEITKLSAHVKELEGQLALLSSNEG